MDGGTSVSKSQSSNFIITFDQCYHPGIISNLFIYLFIYSFIYSFAAPPPPPSCNVNSIRRFLSWPPDNNDTKFQKTVASGPTSWIYIHIPFAYDCVVVVAVVVGRFFFVYLLFFSCIMFLIYLFYLLLFLMLLCWLTGFTFTLKLVHHVIFDTCDVIGFRFKHHCQR